MDLDLRGTAVLFDKDGTLFDFTASWAAASAEILRQLAQGDAERLRLMARAGGYDLATQTFLEDSIIIAGTVTEVSEVLAKAGDLPRAEVQAVTEAVVATARMVPVGGLRPALDALCTAGARLAVVTNDSEAAAVAHLAANDLLDLFDAVVGYDSGYAPKPAPGSCLGAAARIGVAPERCVMVGDSTHDLEAGKAAGMICLAVLTGIAGAAVLSPRAEAVLTSVAEVPAWLAQNGGSRKTTANVAFDT